MDASRPINDDSLVQLLTWNDKEGKSTFWHSSAHLMAEALKRNISRSESNRSACRTGFYYDIDTGEKSIGLLAELETIEKKMAELASQKNVYSRKDVSKADALNYFTEKGDQYKRIDTGPSGWTNYFLYPRRIYRSMQEAPHYRYR